MGRHRDATTPLGCRLMSAGPPGLLGSIAPLPNLCFDVLILDRHVVHDIRNSRRSARNRFGVSTFISGGDLP